MAVEHLERSSGRTAEAPPPPTRSESPAAVHAPAVLQGPPPRYFYDAPPAAYSHGHYPPPPQASSFLHQPRVVTDAEGAGPTPVLVVQPAASEDMMSPDDARHIEELRRLIFQVDLFEWKNLPKVDEKEVITKVTHADVLCGRGGETNHHKGNITFRACVKACQPAYIEAKRREKPYIAQRIVVFIRKMGGRFLKREGDSLAGGGGGDAWKDVGNNKAREKTSQALREGAPELRGDNLKEVVSITTSAPSVYVRGQYYEYGGRPVPKMVTVNSGYDAVPSAPVWHAPHHSAPQIDATTVSRRPSKKQKRRESHYAKAAETVLAHCPRPKVVQVGSEGSLTMLGDPREPTTAAGATECPPSPSVRGTPRVTVSSDEEERSNSSLPSSIHHSQRPTSAAAALRAPTAASTVPSVVVAHSGPRLKLLKKRILSTDSC